MSKIIKANYNEQNESIILQEDAKANDTVSLNKLTNFDKYIETQAKQKYEKVFITNYKNTDEYKNLVKLNEEIKEQLNKNKIKITELEKNVENSKLKAIEEFRESDEYKNLKQKEKDLINSREKIKELEADKKNIELTTKEEFRNSNEYKELLKDKEEKQKLEINISNLVNNHKEEKERLQKQIDELIKQKKELNIKELGEEFEQECLKMYENKLGNYITDSYFKKANDIKHGKKPDFIFTVMDEEKKEIIGTIVLEMKTKFQHTANNKKNNDYLETLEKNRINNKADFAILVTELEPTDLFYIKKPDNQYPNIYICRPDVMVELLSVFRLLFLKYKHLKTQVEVKKDLIDKFEDWKNKMIQYIEYIDKDLVSIKDCAETIKTKADKIIEQIDKAKERHFVQLQKNIENLSVVEKIEKEFNI